MLGVYWNNPPGLVFLATLRLSGPGAAQAVKPIYQRVLELDPDNINALTVLGGMYSDAGDLRTAEDYLTHAVRLAPECGAAHYNLALLMERTGRLSDAIQHYENAALFSPDDPDAADIWGVCLARENRNAEACEWFSRAVATQPTYVPARLHLAMLLNAMGRPQEALAQARFLVRLAPENRAFLDLAAKLEARCRMRPVN